MKRNTYSEEKNKFERNYFNSLLKFILIFLKDEEEDIDYSGLDWEEAEIRPSKR